MAPTVRSFSADFEPLDFVERWPERYPGLLESGATIDNDVARFDILPFACGGSLTLNAQHGLTGEHAGERGFLASLENWWRSLELPPAACSEDVAALPFSGGWLVYLSYEVAAEIEPMVRLPASADPLVAWAVRAPAAFIRRRLTGQGWLIAEPGFEHLLDEFVVRCGELRPRRADASSVFHIEEEAPDLFLDAVRHALEYTAAGEVYQTNLSRQWSCSTSSGIDPIAIYKRLRSANPSPFAAILRRGDFALLSSSPERLFSSRGGIVATRPIAGTCPRGFTAEDDAVLMRALLASEKERAEHVMLIDLERNDLGRVCEPGSVRVDEYMGVETYAHVHHLVSNISGRLRADVSPIGVVRALFPGGTITGCPKVRCMQVIAQLEGCGRGAYTGSIGYLNRDGSSDFNILIRTMTASASKLTFRAGAGIVADSDPTLELAETRAKAKGMLRALEVES